MNLKYAKLLLTLHIIIIFSLAGCGFLPSKYFGPAEPESNEALHYSLKDGSRFFRGKKFEEAEKIFERLVSSENLIVARGALYGLACTRLMLAESDAEYHDAARLLDQWRDGSSGSFGLEDPRMLLSAFSKVVPIKPGESPENSGNAVLSKEPLIMRYFSYEKEISDLRRRLADMEAHVQVVELRNASMEAMEKELETLRNQIKTIETIDQKIQEKKQGISSP